MPRMTTETIGGGDMSWLASDHGIFNARTATLDVSTFTKATHYPDGYLPCGTPVNAANRAALTPWSDAAGAVLAFVDGDQPTDGVEDINVALVTHGDGIIVKNLPVTFAKPATAPQPQFGQYL